MVTVTSLQQQLSDTSRALSNTREEMGQQAAAYEQRQLQIQDKHQDQVQALQG